MWKRIFSRTRKGFSERHDMSQPKTSSFGDILEEQKPYLLRFARYVLEHSYDKEISFVQTLETLKKEHEEKRLLEYFSPVHTVDVILWVGGVMRGSQVVHNLPLGEGLYEATLRAKEDPRYRPVEQEELGETVIEIVVISPSVVPVSKQEMKLNHIDEEKAYGVMYEDKKEWVVPAIYNCFSFTSLSSLLAMLAHTKLSTAFSKEVQPVFYTADIMDIVESVDKQDAMTMRGPVVSTSSLPHTTGSLSHDTLASEIASHIAKMQESNGVLRRTLSLTSHINEAQIDWVRFSCALYALSLYAKVFGDTVYEEAIQKGMKYLQRYLFTHRTMRDEVRLHALLYYEKITKLNSLEHNRKRAQEYIDTLLMSDSYMPYMYIQAGLYLVTKSPTSKEDIARVERFGEVAYQAFLKDKNSSHNNLDTALYADLMVLYTLLYEKTMKEVYKEKIAELHNFYLRIQKEDGSYPVYFGLPYAHTRSSAKIYEALSRIDTTNGSTDERVEQAKKHLLAWLMTMQYREEHMYHVHKDLREIAVYGFRHDYTNKDVWIDTSAHLLIALCYQKREVED